ncbi:MAG: family 43 glycosylhydrolase [Pyrinomonadaceae bacterium]
MPSIRRSIILSIRAACAPVLLALCLWTVAPAQQKAAYTNPVIAGDFPDPSVIRVGEDYWAATTSGNWAPHFPLLHSRDLVNWRVAGAVFQKAPEWIARDFWAPEIQEDRGRFFVYYTGRKKNGPLCVAVATAARPEGPYTDHGPLVCQDIGSIDAFMTRDENGRPFLIWKEDGNDRNQPTPIWAQPLSEDGTKMLGKRKEILRNTAPWERHVVEGSFIVRRGGWFYHFYSGNACCGRGCDYALGVARSRKLLGPWAKHPRNPILPANDEWQCPGHGSIVTLPDGRDFLLYHSYRRRADAMNIGREALLDEIKWGADGWPSINGGRGPTSAAPSPLGVAELPDNAEFFDGFDDARLDAGWQWPMSGEQPARVEAARGGHLILTANAGASGDGMVGAVVARPTVTGSYVATALVDARGMAKGARAGLAAYSWRGNALGVAVGDGKVFVWRHEGKDQLTVASADAPASAAVYLRMTAADGERYRFAVSADGRDWRELGDAVSGSHVGAARVALTAGGPAGAAARFDWVRVTPTVTAKD